MENELWFQVEPKIRAGIEALAERKRESKSKIAIYGSLIGVLMLIITLPIAGVFGLLIALAIGYGGVYMYYRYRHNQQYKAEIVPILVDAICPGATYSPKGTLDKEIIQVSKLYNAGWGESFSNEDTIRGKVGKTDFVYGEVTLSHTESNGKQTRTVIDFKGFVFEADFNKYFNGLTLLSSEKLRLTTQIGLFSSLKRCKLEDVDFEKRYKTYTTNDQEARYILSPALQQRIMQMNDTFRSQLGDAEINISFHDSRMLIMVPSQTDRFEIKYTVEGVKQDLLALTVLIGIVQQLNLNLRIWTKE